MDSNPFSNALRIDLLDPATLRELSAKPERLRERIEDCTGLKTVLIDEAQKLPQLLEVIHALIEEKRGIQFVLTGSSARKLRRTGGNLLGVAPPRSVSPLYGDRTRRSL